MRSEHVEQREFVAWVRKTYPDYKIFAIPNGGLRNISTAARLKAEGASAGVPDLFVPALKLFIEMKDESGRASEKQVEWMEYLLKVGYRCCLCHGVESAKKAFLSAL